ncbi:response regulator [Candidatus Leptofilum sp.]|uniref:response regulator n=1 Tax=Candidatus Leptofilum sp. TaxID=3241576 RepID=UPI003B5A58F5
MVRVLVIDDDRLIRRVVKKALSDLNYEVVETEDGLEALKRIKSIRPDAVIVDKMMPGIDGFEVTRRLRREPELAHIPILVLTGESDLQEKLAAFEAGADDYVCKPFAAAELAARLTVLLRRAKALEAAQAQTLSQSDQGRMIAVHSLRGGIGTSSLASNLAVGLRSLWQNATLLMDMVPNAGQQAMMLNMPVKRTWADLNMIPPEELDVNTLSAITRQHDSGLHLIASPKLPSDAEGVTASHFDIALKFLKNRYDYIVADLPHNFSSLTLEVLEAADYILLVTAPEIASVRAASIALETYKQLNYPEEKIKVVLNWTFERDGLAHDAIESALHAPIQLVIPYGGRRFLRAINQGVPLLHEIPEDPIAELLEDFCFRLSKETHQSIAPAAPSAAWHRLNERLQLFAATQRKQRSRFSLVRG